MKFTVTFILTISLSVTCHGLPSIFEKTFKLLHQEPPPPPSTSRIAVGTHWIEQKLDQFNVSDTRTWQMRYLSNDQYFVDGGPIFILVGGEWSISKGQLRGGHMHDMAKEHRGYLFYTEHRYYGKSKPTPDLQTENLKYLNVKQALADLAHFIRTVKATTPGLEKSKVILTGASYSATMVTWFKRLYPDLIVGAWASSAPVFAKVNFIEYKEITGQSIKLVGGEACYKRIQNGFAGLENMLANNQVAEIRKLLTICDNFNGTNDLDVWSLFWGTSNIFAGIVQRHNDGDIQRACTKIMQGEDDVIGLSSFIVSFVGFNKCIDYTYDSMISYMKKPNYGEMMRQWTFQTCNEYGWYQTSGSTAQPFGTKFPLAYRITVCHDLFGDDFTNETIHKNADDTNEYFGGWNPEVENVYSTHGQLDPWRAMGLNDTEKATILPMQSHCKDLASIKSTDAPELKASKEKIAELVRTWVQDKSEMTTLLKV